MDERIEQLRAQVAADPTSRAFFQLGEALRRQGQVEEAVEVLEKGLPSHETWVAPWVCLGRCRFQLKDHEGAEQAFRKVMELDPENHVAQRMLGSVAIEREDWLGAVKALKRARAFAQGDKELDEQIEMVERKLDGPSEPAADPLPPPPPPPAQEPPAAEAGPFEAPAAQPAAEPTPAVPSDGQQEEVFTSGGADPFDLEPTGSAPAPPSAGGDVFGASADVFGADSPSHGAEATPPVPSPDLAPVPSKGFADSPPDPREEPVATEPQPFAVPPTSEATPSDGADEDQSTAGASSEPHVEDEATFPPPPFAGDPNALTWPDEAEMEAEVEAASEEASPEPPPTEAAAAEQDDDEPLATATLARLAFEQGDLELAEETARKVLARQPDSEAATKVLDDVEARRAGDVVVPPGAGDATERKIRGLQSWLDEIRAAAEARSP